MGRLTLRNMIWALPFATFLAVFWTIPLFATFPRVVRAGTVSLPSYPLAVKSPYLSTWVPGNQTTDAATAQPEFWAGQPLNWTVLGRVNGATYSLFGVSHGVDNCTAAKTVGISYTSSHTLIDLVAGNASVKLDFFSPVLPGDYLVQSLPYSYLTVSTNSTQNITVLSAIDKSWASQESVNLNYTASNTTGFFQFNNPKAIPFTERSDMATYGSVIFATDISHRVSQACGPAASVYGSFVANGHLNYYNSSSNCSGTDLAALANNIGPSTRNHSSVTFAVGFDREQAIDYLNVTQTGYYRSQWPTVSSAVSFFLQNYPKALATSKSFDSAVRSRSVNVSSAFGSQYADIVEASVRQTFGAIEFTVPESNLNATPYAFIKEISSDGNVNTMDIIFQSYPIFISLQPTILRFLLQPILDYLEMGGWPAPWVVHDLGSAYPNATGHNNGVAEQMPLFETSSLFIMMYAYQKYTNDTAWAGRYLPLLENYAKYLAANSLYPASQLISVDSIAGRPNQTALAIQSTIGLNAASVLTGNSTYAKFASSFANMIYNDALGLDGPTLENSTHFTYYYGSDSTWNVLFAAFSDVLLDLNTFPSSAWSMQSNWYMTQMQELGLPFAGPMTDLDYTGSPINWALSDWNIVAASVSSATVQEAVINTTHAFLTDGLNTVPFGTKYYVTGPNAGKWISNEARSTVGSDFALLALEQGTWGTQYTDGRNDSTFGFVRH